MYLNATYIPFRRDMTKQMLKVVKLEEKKKYVEDFENLDYVGKKELPCVKAIQESYASKYPVLLNTVGDLKRFFRCLFVRLSVHSFVPSYASKYEISHPSEFGG